MFYSAIYRDVSYHQIGLKNDLTGNPNGPYFDFYTLWDTFRCLNSPCLLIESEIQETLVQTLIDIWRHERFMPDVRSSNYNGQVQGGSNADNI
jgi:putative alpha-1,2-mannosidase